MLKRDKKKKKEDGKKKKKQIEADIFICRGCLLRDAGGQMSQLTDTQACLCIL